MAMVKLDDSTLHNIADKIREKNKEVASYKPSEMPDAIDRIVVTERVIEPLEVTANGTYEAPVGVHGYNPITVDVPPTLEDIEITANGEYTSSNADGFGKVTVNTPTIPDEALNITGDCRYKFAYDGWKWFLDMFGNRITTHDINNMQSMLRVISNESIPFTLNITNCDDMSYMFYISNNIRVCPKIRGTIEWRTSTTFESMLEGLDRLPSFDDLFTPEMIDGFAAMIITSAYSTPKLMNFDSCKSMRSVPQWFYHLKLNEASTNFPYAYIYEDLFNHCIALDEVRDLQVWRCQSGQSTNMLDRTFRHCARSKSITFETNEDRTPVVAQWKNQLLDLTVNVGYTGVYSIPSASGITEDKKVTDDATYQALKDDPDWFTASADYSRYNHNSAVETINSLPDTSAYLAQYGGTNTIKFKGTQGRKTDGGAISTLTEEEIAVATAKGWTVTLI